jgi:flagellar hook assembly protein FlgD
LDATPNPFNPSVAVRYRLSRASNVAIVVFDLYGRRVRQLVRQTEEAGTHETIWDGCDDEGHAVASGGYVARLEAGGQSRTTKLMLVR